MKNLAYLIFTITLFVGCGKNDDASNNSAGILYPLKLTYKSRTNGSSSTDTYKYDSKHRLIRSTESSGVITEFSYTNDNLTGIKITNLDKSTEVYQFIYEGNKLKNGVLSRYNSSNSIQATTFITYTVNEAGKVLSGELSGYQRGTFVVTWTGENVSKIVTNGSVKEWTFSELKHPFASQKALHNVYDGFFLTEMFYHMNAEASFKSGPISLKNHSLLELEYSGNKLGYPTSRTITLSHVLDGKKISTEALADNFIEYK